MSIVDDVKAAGEDYEDVLYDKYGIDVYDPIDTKVVDRRRWTVREHLHFEHDGKYYRLVLDQPATEMQEGQDRFVDFYEVEKTTRTVVVFQPVQA